MKKQKYSIDKFIRSHWIIFSLILFLFVVCGACIVKYVYLSDFVALIIAILSLLINTILGVSSCLREERKLVPVLRSKIKTCSYGILSEEEIEKMKCIDCDKPICTNYDSKPIKDLYACDHGYIFLKYIINKDNGEKLFNLSCSINNINIPVNIDKDNLKIILCLQPREVPKILEIILNYEGLNGKHYKQEETIKINDGNNNVDARKWRVESNKGLSQPIEIEGKKNEK